MDIEYIINQYYKKGTKLYDIFIDHADKVREKSVYIASRIAHVTQNSTSNIKPDIKFIEEAAMLHDIGIFMTNSPSIYCMGEYPYICHGFLGRELLDSIGFPRHGLVSERHTGAGITLENIIANSLPLPHRDMVPVTIEEEIICFADKFYSKKPKWVGFEKSLDKIMEEMEKLDQQNYSHLPILNNNSHLDKKSDYNNKTHSERFSGWVKKFLI
ncbi:MAG: phosphohydrolase [Desulfamplus sp.]|nr:phosphohydrolase [Desulfamplus sp.]